MDSQSASDWGINGLNVCVDSEEQLEKLRQNYPDSIDLQPFEQSTEEFPVVMEGQFTEDGIFRVIGVFSESATQFEHTFDEFYEELDDALAQFEE